MTNDRVVLGRIIRPHGIRGSLLLRSNATAIDVLRPGLPIRVEPREAGGKAAAGVIRRASRHRAGAIIELEGLDDREAAGALAARDLTVSRDTLPSTPEGAFYACDLIGATVVSATGDVLGTLVEVVPTGANDVWVVRGAEGELLVPAVDHAVLEVNVTERRVVVDVTGAYRAGDER